MSKESKIEFFTRIFGADYSEEVLIVEPIHKSPKEKSLFDKYKFLIRREFVSERTINCFKKDLLSLKLKVGLATCLFLLCSNITLAQSEIVVGSGSLGNGSFVIGGNIIDVPMLYENKFTKKDPIPFPKPRPSRKGMKYKKSEKQKLKEALRKLTIKK